MMIHWLFFERGGFASGYQSALFGFMIVVFVVLVSYFGATSFCLLFALLAGVFVFMFDLASADCLFHDLFHVCDIGNACIIET